MAKKNGDINWHAQFQLDLNAATPAAFAALVEQFDVWRQAQPVDNSRLSDGWHTITPMIAERLLKRNPAGANRKANLANVRYYANQMKADDWPETGQPIIFSKDGDLVDGQHRGWASYLSGASFTTYVVSQRKEIDDAFAYIDNNKARSPRDAFTTSGYGGLSGVMSQVVSMAQYYDADAYTPTHKHEVVRWSPKHKLVYANEHPNLKLGCQLMAGEHASASAVIVHRDVAAFAAACILDFYDGAVLDEFMAALGSEGGELEAGNAILALQTVLEADQIAKEPMKRHQVLGYIIKAFNAWRAGETVKKLSLRVNEPFPRFDQPEQAAAA